MGRDLLSAARVARCQGSWRCRPAHERDLGVHPMPRLLVVMPARNARHTLRSAVTSTLRSMPNDSALLVWDDGSTDSTLESIADISDRRLLIRRSSESHGSGMARRNAMLEVDSELVANMDADDYCFPWRFYVQLPKLQRYDIVFAGVVKFWSRLRARPAIPLRFSPSESELALLLHNPFSHSTMSGRRSAIEGAGGYRNLRTGQDYDLWLRLAANGSAIFAQPTPVAGYRQSTTQISRGPDYMTSLLSQPEITESRARLFNSIRSQENGQSSVHTPTYADLKRLFLERKDDLSRPLQMFYVRLLDSDGDSLRSSE
jgi:glycosyltransferase involved in cell wall biosynthesis